MKERIESFHQALQRLQEALEVEETALSRDASIQRFEFTVELAWKAVQKFLASEQILCQSPKSCFQEALKFGLIEDDEKWISKEIFGRLPGYVPLLSALHQKLSVQIS